MICRAHDHGWLLISQPAHAWMAGKLAAAWGNERFDAPAPWAAVVLATRLHDIGWLDWDANPRLGEDGRPVNFLDTNLDETIPLWRHAVQWIRIMNPFSALLVSMHASTIYSRRLERGADPREKQLDIERALLEHDQFRTELRQNLAGHAVYGEAIEQEKLAVIYRWLRVCDLLSLAVLAEALPKVGRIEEVPTRHDDGFTEISYRYLAPSTLEIAPWPFKGVEVQVPVDARYVDQARFDSRDAFHAKLETAPWRSLVTTLRPLK